MFILRLLPALILVAAIGPALAEDRGSRDAGAAATGEIAGDAEVGPTNWETYDLATDGSFNTMGDTPPDIGLVQRIFELSFAEPCEGALSGVAGGPSPESFDITYKASYDAAEDPARLVRLYQFFCNAGAYNSIRIYMTWESSWGLRPVLFPTPDLDITYEDENSMDGRVETITVQGFTATPTVVNPWYDAATQTITTLSWWRGMGDASSSGVYVFDDGQFVLKTYDVDASYDGEFNPYRVVDFTSPTPAELIAVDPVIPPEEVR